ncbi:MAG: TlpA family protein disulfide reductase [Clostridia bacterium]|nr:TlpA family protein disulfide reductase [Clostridia bacterium]
MLIGCASALAETTIYKELGLAIDFSAIQDKSANYPFLKNWGVGSRDPFLSSMGIYFVNLPKTVIETISEMEEGSEDAEAWEALEDALTVNLGAIYVTNAKSLVEAGADESLLAQCEVTEFGTQGDYHYFLVYNPDFVLDKLSSFYDAADTGDYEHSPQEMKATALADIELVCSELRKALQAAELFEPVDTAAEFIGQVVEFESVDLDGNVVKSADLFKDNKVTMVNLWGSWCINCVNEMAGLAELHKRLQEKGCGIVGVEYERGESVEKMADTARKVLADNGVTYPNVWIPEGNPIFAQAGGFPFSLFVDSEGKILTYPIKGAPRDAISVYESTFEKLLAGEAIVDSPETGSTKNESGEYRVFVYDEDGNPVKGVIVQLCDESTCSFQKTKADGMAIFQVDEPKVYDVHVGKVPEGYQTSDEAYKTLDTYSDTDIFISKVE